MVLCIVHCDLDEDEAMEYATSVCAQFTFNNAQTVCDNLSELLT